MKKPPPPKMAAAASSSDDQLSSFLKLGIYQLYNANAVFIDPVRILNRSYTNFRVSPSKYYSRSFSTSPNFSIESHNSASKSSKKRKRRQKEKKKYIALNSREQIADQRHQEVRLPLLKAHEELLGASELLEILRNLRRNDGEEFDGESISKESEELDFVELGSVWQAPLYEIVLKVVEDGEAVKDAGAKSYYQRFPVFDNLVENEGSNEREAELLDHEYILPKNSCFYMSDLKQIHNLTPAESDCGFNFIAIDPPWENGSAHQKHKYQTLPNRYLLSLPIKQLTHTVGALVALWVTNREKLRNFVENELFPKWGVKHVATFYWLKVKADGSLISELDLFHHRPYECLLLGYSLGKSGPQTHQPGLTHPNPGPDLGPGLEMNPEELLRFKHIPDNQVFISVPGDYSRKPPIGELLLDYVPGFKPARCIELFSREMIAGWTSWGNEPLRFQDLKYFLRSKESEF
ncbi:hypothetical protein BUALT_Bualt01G0034900 [Buddleja alternifolia]|uniref:Methyltransferase-like protein 2 n=1 Tax=Buddleja alternifolia TaxID=168488 RepID=A0AAV6YAU4_9LAMI|nr:hypothetical protein BUALT_Bualt01G0034900 [Buddleja alternifolia]